MTPKQRLDAAILAQQAIVNAARADGNRSLTAEEQAEFERLQGEINQTKAEIISQERGIAGGEGSQNPPSTTQTQAGATPDEASRAQQGERTRAAEIVAICRDFEMDPGEYIANGTSVEQVRAEILDGLRRTSGPVSTRTSSGRVSVTRDEGDTFRERAADGLMLRAGIQAERVAEGANEMRGTSLRDLAMQCLARDEGRDYGQLMRMNMDDLYLDLCRQFYNPTAAFPAILDSTIRKSVVHIYNHVPTTFQAWTQKGSLKDFKPTADHEYVIGGTGDFLKVPENGELKSDTPKSDILPSRKLDTYGRQFSMTRQAFINDDISFLTEVPGLYAASAKKTIDKMVYKILYNNGKIFDGVSLFDAAKHNNQMKAAGKPSQASIQAMILQMQKQKDQFGDAIYVAPKHIIVPVGYEFDLAVILRSAQVVGSSNNDINPLYNYPLSIVQTPILNALAGENAAPWFMVADPISAKSIQVDYLNGQETPTIRRMETPGTLGFAWDIYLDWGIAVRDWRGICRNNGEKIE